MIENEFIPYQLALELKQLGFDEPCLAYYKNGRITGVNKWDREAWDFHVITNKDITSVTSEIVIAPTYSQAFRFFRENYHLIGGIQYIGGETPKTTWWDIYVVGHYNVDYKEMSMKYQPYEDAEKACLKKLIEIVKLNNQ